MQTADLCQIWATIENASRTQNHFPVLEQLGLDLELLAEQNVCARQTSGRPGRAACGRPMALGLPVQLCSLRASHPTPMLLLCRTSQALGSVSFIPCGCWELLSGQGSSCPGPGSPFASHTLPRHETPCYFYNKSSKAHTGSPQQLLSVTSLALQPARVTQP